MGSSCVVRSKDGGPPASAGRKAGSGKDGHTCKSFHTKWTQPCSVPADLAHRPVGTWLSALCWSPCYSHNSLPGWSGEVVGVPFSLCLVFLCTTWDAAWCGHWPGCQRPGLHQSWDANWPCQHKEGASLPGASISLFHSGDSSSSSQGS